MKEKLYLLPNGAGAVKPSAVNSIDRYNCDAKHFVRVITKDSIIPLEFESKDQADAALRQIAEGLDAILEETVNRIQGKLQEIGEKILKELFS